MSELEATNRFEFQPQHYLESEVWLDNKGDAVLAKPVSELVELVHRHREAGVRYGNPVSVCANKATEEVKSRRDI